MRKVLAFLAALAIAVVAVILIAEPFASKPASAAAGELRFVDCLANGGSNGCAALSDSGGVLGSAVDVAVSPDGQDVYAGAWGVIHFSRSPDGSLSFADCTENGGGHGCLNPASGEEPLSGAKKVAVSPDGKNLYVASSESNSLSRFDLGTDGSLSFAGCFSNGGDNGCANPSAGNNPLTGASDVTVSPDGKSVYVTAVGSDSVSWFNRTADGTVTFAGCISDGGADGCTDPSPGNSPLHRAVAVAVSHDGNSVYVVAEGPESNSLSRFNRNATTGSLSFQGCFGEDSACTHPSSGDPLNGPEGLAVSPDGKNVYVTGSGADSIVIFNRVADGAVSYADCIANNGLHGCKDPKAGNNPLDGAWNVAVSADGADVYVTSIVSSSLSRFRRSSDGSLTFASCFANGGAAGCATPGPGTPGPLGGARGVAVSPDSKSVYVASLNASSVSRFSVGVPSAPSSGILFWANHDGNKISFTNLDGSGGGDLNTGTATVNGPSGLAIDSAAGRVYWLNRYSSDKISYANLAGSGGGDVASAGTSLSYVTGLAIDPSAQRIYWGNGSSVSFVGLNGADGGNLNMSGASPGSPHGVTIDTAAGRIYWAVGNYNRISYANLDGSGGGGDLDTTGATLNSPEGVAIDQSAGKIYWANRSVSGPAISFAELAGGGGGTLNTAGATAYAPFGVAIDPEAEKIYWGDYYVDTVSYANLDGSGGGDLAIPDATVNGPTYPVLLKAPIGSGAPTISGGSTVGSTLSCSGGSWAPDLLGSFLYRAPQSFAYQWSRDGAGIGGATATSYTADSAGQYRCTVTASNRAGAASQTSTPHAVEQQQPPPPPPPPAVSNAFSFGKLELNKKKGTAKLTVSVPGAGALSLTGKEVAAQRLTATRAGKVKLLVKPKGKAKRKLDSSGTAKVKVKVTYTPSGGTSSAKSKTIKLVKRR